MPSPEDMLQELVAANRDAYEQRSGEPITNPASFDLAFRKRKLADEEARPGSIERAYQNLTGTGARRNAATKSTPITELDYSGGLAATLLASVDLETGARDWNDNQIISMLIEADDISDTVARRAFFAAKPAAAKTLEGIDSRRNVRAFLAERDNPTRTIIPRLEVVPPPDDEPEAVIADPPPDDDPDDDAIWNQEPA